MMDFGVHLPVLVVDGMPVPVSQLLDYAEYVERLEFSALAGHDHLVYAVPWVDGPTTLAAAAARTTRIPLLTAVALPVLRGPLAMARAFTALDLLSNGRVIAGIGAGSSARDFAATGIPFAERWARFDEAVQVMRALWARDVPPFRGRFYSTDGIAIAPLPAQRNGPPIWIGSWGSEAGLRRAARLGDGWIASAYNITPEGFATAWQQLGQQLRSLGKDPEQFPNAIATMAMYVTEDRSAAQRMLEEVVSPLLSRPADDLRRSLLIGSAEECATTLQAYHAAGVQRVLLMPTRDGFRQLDLFRERVLSLLGERLP